MIDKGGGEEKRVHLARIRIRDTIRDYVYVGGGIERGRERDGERRRKREGRRLELDPSRQDRGDVVTLCCTGRKT